MRGEQLDGVVDVVDEQREPPEARRVARARRSARRTSSGSCDELEDLAAEAEEGLARRAGGCRLLAHPAQIEAGGLQRSDAAVEIGRDRDDVVDTDRPPFGCASAGGDAGLCEALVGSPSRSVLARSRSDQPMMPRPDCEPAKRTRTPASWQQSSLTAKPSAAQRSGSSASVS